MRRSDFSAPFEALVVGASTGGVELLTRLLPALPDDFPAPVIVCLHAGADTTEGLISLLRSSVTLPVAEAEHLTRPLPGTVYFAPGGYHLLIERDTRLALSLDPPVRFARPAVDVLFESAAACWGNRLVGLILSGASSDGADGVRAIRARGGCVLAQDPHSAVAPVMPQAAIEAVTPDAILSPEDIVPALCSRFGTASR